MLPERRRRCPRITRGSQAHNFSGRVWECSAPVRGVARYCCDRDTARTILTNMEITSDLGFSVEESTLLDMHSVLNVMNVMNFEVMNLSETLGDSAELNELY